MLLIKAREIETSYGDRQIFRAEKLEVADGDRIGIVGRNGSGKTTLMSVLAIDQEPEQGEVLSYSAKVMIKQIEEETGEGTSSKSKGTWGISRVQPFMSGGEKNRLKIAAALDQKAPLLFADEPTSHLDMQGIQQLEEALRSYPGAMVLISHDRELLDAICTRTWEVENGAVSEYRGNYSAYLDQKEIKRNREYSEYEAYEKEKARLLEAMTEKKQKAKKIKKAPSRMGNSEARLHKRSANESKEKLEKSSKALESRLAQLEKKEKPQELP